MKIEICKQCECVDMYINNIGLCTQCRTGMWHNKFQYKHIEAFSPRMRLQIVNGLQLTQELLADDNWNKFLISIH